MKGACPFRINAQTATLPITPMAGLCEKQTFWKELRHLSELT